MNSVDLSFGEGGAEVVESITVFWPSGVRQVLRNLQGDQVIPIEVPGPPTMGMR